MVDDGGIVFVFDDDVEFGEGVDDEVEVMWKRIFYVNFVVGDGVECEEGDDFVVVGCDVGFVFVEFFYVFDVEYVGVNVVDFGVYCG